MPKAVLELEDPDVIRQFVNGPCTREARTIVEEAGIYNIHSDEWDAAISAAIETALGGTKSADDRVVMRVIDALLNAKAPIAPEAAIELAQALDSAHIVVVMRQREVAYLVGLAVGRMMGGGR